MSVAGARLGMGAARYATIRVRNWRGLGGSVWLVLVAVIVGCAMVLASNEIGSGDYGQWLMASRPYLGLSVPDYRVDSAIPPVVPLVLALAVRLVGDPVLALRLVTSLILAGLAFSAYAAAGALFRSRLAGLIAGILALLLAGPFLELFAFGGLLQAAAIVWLWSSVAVFARAARGSEDSWGWWIAGAVFVGLGALTHMGTAAIALPTGLVVAMLGAYTSAASWRDRASRLVPVAIVLAGVGIYWITALLPGGTELASNPASLAYRGPLRLVAGLASSPLTLVVAVTGIGAIAFGVAGECRRRSIGPWIMIGSWIAITLAVVVTAVIAGAATDYPRFLTPILAPLVVGAAGILVVRVTWAGRRLASIAGTGSPVAWSLALVIGLIGLSAPPAVGSFATAAAGYRLAGLDGLREAAQWIERNVAQGATIAAPAREAKWVEGLTGRATLFSNAVRYSFRPEEWQRSLAADTLVGSSGALVNEYFFARLADPASPANDLRGVIVGTNHGGEFVDLLSLVPSRTQVVAAGSDDVIATVTNLTPAGQTDTLTDDTASVVTAWTGQRRGTTIAYHQALTLLRHSSALEIRGVVTSAIPVEIRMTLQSSSRLRATSIVVAGNTATMTFPRLGPTEPRVLVTVAGTSAQLQALPDGALGISSSDPQVRLLITDLTAAPSPTMGLQLLHPAEIVDRYRVGAVVLLTEPSLGARLQRLEALGFRSAATFGPYVLLNRPT